MKDEASKDNVLSATGSNKSNGSKKNDA